MSAKITPDLLGITVWWYPDGDRHADPLPAIVTRIGEFAINVNIFDATTFNTHPRDGVRHLSEVKETSRDQLRDSGAWDYPTWMRPLLKLLALPKEEPKK